MYIFRTFFFNLDNVSFNDLLDKIDQIIDPVNFYTFFCYYSYCNSHLT